MTSAGAMTGQQKVHRLVIVGGGAAGDAAAEAVRRAGFEGQVLLVGADRHPAYHRPYLSKQFLRDELPFERVFLHRPDVYERLKVEWLAGRRAVAGSRPESSITLDDGRSLRFDALVLATGGSPRWPAEIPRADNVFSLRSLDDCLALKQALAGSRRLLLIGAGFIGAEVAASMRTRGRDVLVVERSAVPLRRALGDEMGEVYARMHREHGVDLRTGRAVARWLTTGSGRVEAVELDDGAREEIDVALVAVGIEPELALARELGLPLDSGGVLVDETLRAAPGIYCAGDIAAHLHPVFRRHLRVEHWQVARKQGLTIGAAVAGQARPHQELPWFWSDQYDVNLQYVGHAEGFDEAVWRGDRGSGHFSVFYLKEGLVEAVLAVNDARAIRFGRELIRQRHRVASGVLTSESTDLGTLTVREEHAR